MSRVAIVIVTHNSAREIGPCLTSLRLVPDAEVVVVDNASSDETLAVVQRFPVRLIANSENAGFAGGVNLGTRETSSPLVLLLNPDAQLRSDLRAMAEAFEAPGARTGIVGGLLTDGSGQPQTGFMIRNLPTPAALCFEVLGINRLFPRNPINWQYRCIGKHPMTPGPAEQPAGAFLMFSRQAWLDVGGFDERFTPVWFEDVDFCARVRKSGYRIWYTPAAVASHVGGHSVNALAVGNRHKYWYGNLLKYAARHFGNVQFRVVCAAVALGASLRAVSETPRGGFRAFQMYGVVIRQACRQLLSSREQVSAAERRWCVKSGSREN
ncbi:MAG: glycosyl transferase, family 2 [Bryobacterales bacterium]|nr:glycosyl transferase, family 2 [Bryobacterales bacterium]